MKFVDEDGETVKYAYVDGYNFGERLLEGVIFCLTIKDDKVTADIRKADASYMKQLNKKMWVKEAVKYAVKGGDLTSTAEGGKEVRLKNKTKKDPCACPYESTGVPVGVRCSCLSCRGADM